MSKSHILAEIFLFVPAIAYAHTLKKLNSSRKFADLSKANAVIALFAVAKFGLPWYNKIIEL